MQSPIIKIQSFVALAIALDSATTLAAPTVIPDPAPRPTAEPSAAGSPQSPHHLDYITATLQSATLEDQRTISISTTAAFTPTDCGTSISHIITTGGQCGFLGIDGLVLQVAGADSVDVGPPQTLVGVVCGDRTW